MWNFKFEFYTVVNIPFILKHKRIFTMPSLVTKVETLLLQESLDTLCGASVVYLTIEDNVLPPYNKVREIVDRAVSSSLSKIEDLERKTKVLEILPQVACK
jgi:hypothetical protein